MRIVRGDEPLMTAPTRGSPRRGAAKLGVHLPVYAQRSGTGCAEPWFHVGPNAWVCGEGAELSDVPPVSVDAEILPHTGGLPYRYSFVNDLGSLGYRELATAEMGAPDLELEPGFAIALARTADRFGEPFGLTPHGYWVPLRDLRPARPSVFQGIAAEDLRPPLTSTFRDLAWTVRDDAPVRRTPGGAIVRRIAGRHVRLQILEQRGQGQKSWLRVAQSEWVAARDIARFLPATPPAELQPGERWVDIDLTEQILTAYAGTQPVFATLVSTGKGQGKAENATPLGEHRIWVKLMASDMSNLEAADANRYYSMQSVPWVMYFKKGYGVHGAYWHDDFGQRRSHGCVNLSPPDAARLFRWTEPRLPAGWTAILPSRYERGTLIRVRSSGS